MKVEEEYAKFMLAASNLYGAQAETKITRAGVTFPPELLKDFDEIIGKMGYESRSKAIQDSVRLFVSRESGSSKKTLAKKQV